MWPFKPKNATLKEPEWWRQAGFAPATHTGANVTPDTALRVAAVYACVRILGEAVASLPLKMYTTNGSDREVMPDHPLSKLLGITPNGEQTAFEAREFQMTCLGLRGNSYTQVLRDNRGNVGQLNGLNARYMSVDRDSNGQLVFDYQQSGSSKVYSKGDIWRVAGLGTDGVTGLSPIALARESIGTAMGMEEHGAKLFKNGLHTNLVMSFEHALDDEQFNRLRDQLEKTGGFDNSGKPFLAESGMKVTNIGMNNDDAQYLESRKFSVAEIARWYRVPPHMIGDLEKATFSNIEHQSIDFVVHTIRPWLVRIEQSIQRDLLSDREKGVVFPSHTVDGLLRGDTLSRYQAYQLGINSGWLNRNEVRRLENKNQEDGLDEFLIPMNIDQQSERDSRLTGVVANMLANYEISGIKSEAKKSPEGFYEWLPEYYERVAGRMIEASVKKEDAENYVLERIGAFRDFKLTDAVQHIERTALLEIGKLL